MTSDKDNCVFSQGGRAVLEASTSVVPSDRSNMDWSVTELTDVVWRKKWLIAGCIGISVLLGLLYLHFAEPIYAVRARLLVQPQGSPLDTGAEANRDKEFLATQAEIISSPAVIERVLPVVTQSTTANQELEPMLAVLSSLAVDPVSGTNVLSVSYRCQNPSEGISMVDGILRSYQQFLQEMNNDSRSEALRLLTRSEEKLRSDLEKREETYLELCKQSPQQRDGTVYQATVLEGLAKALIEAREHRIDLDIRREILAESSILAISTRNAPHKPAAVAGGDLVDAGQTASIRRASLVPLVQQVKFPAADESCDDNAALDSALIADVELAATPEYSLVSRELLLAEMREKELSRHGGPKHPDLGAAREQVAAWRERLRALQERATFDLLRELTVVETRERKLFELYQHEHEKAQAMDRFLVEKSLELDGIERLKTIHHSIVAQLNDWHLAGPIEDGGLGVSVVVLESPTIGIGPVWPKKSLLLSVCVAIGLLGGIGIVAVTKV